MLHFTFVDLLIVIIGLFSITSDSHFHHNGHYNVMEYEWVPLSYSSLSSSPIQDEDHTHDHEQHDIYPKVHHHTIPNILPSPVVYIINPTISTSPTIDLLKLTIPSATPTSQQSNKEANKDGPTYLPISTFDPSALSSAPNPNLISLLLQPSVTKPSVIIHISPINLHDTAGLLSVQSTGVVSFHSYTSNKVSAMTLLDKVWFCAPRVIPEGVTRGEMYTQREEWGFDLEGLFPDVADENNEGEGEDEGEGEGEEEQKQERKEEAEINEETHGNSKTVYSDITSSAYYEKFSEDSEEEEGGGAGVIVLALTCTTTTSTLKRLLVVSISLETGLPLWHHIESEPSLAFTPMKALDVNEFKLTPQAHTHASLPWDSFKMSFLARTFQSDADEIKSKKPLPFNTGEVGQVFLGSFSRERVGRDNPAKKKRKQKQKKSKPPPATKQKQNKVSILESNTISPSSSHNVIVVHHPFLSGVQVYSLRTGHVVTSLSLPSHSNSNSDSGGGGGGGGGIVYYDFNGDGIIESIEVIDTGDDTRYEGQGQGGEKNNNDNNLNKEFYSTSTQNRNANWLLSRERHLHKYDYDRSAMSEDEDGDRKHDKNHNHNQNKLHRPCHVIKRTGYPHSTPIASKQTHDDDNEGILLSFSVKICNDNDDDKSNNTDSVKFLKMLYDPTIDADSVYVATTNGIIAKIAVSNGKVVWRVDLKGVNMKFTNGNGNDNGNDELRFFKKTGLMMIGDHSLTMLARDSGDVLSTFYFPQIATEKPFVLSTTSSSSRRSEVERKSSIDVLVVTTPDALWMYQLTAKRLSWFKSWINWFILILLFCMFGTIELSARGWIGGDEYSDHFHGSDERRFRKDMDRYLEEEMKWKDGVARSTDLGSDEMLILAKINKQKNGEMNSEGRRR